MHPADVLPGDGGRGAEAVAPGEARDIGLVDGDRGDAQPIGRGDRLRAEEEGGRGVEHVRPEPGEDALHLRARQTDRELPVRERRHLVDAESCVLGRRPRIRADHDRLVHVLRQVVQHSQHARGDPVDRGEEALADHRDSHGFTLRAAGVVTVNGRCPAPLGILSA